MAAVPRRTRGGSLAGRHAVRAAVAAALLVSAWIHLDLWLDGYSGMPVVGALFLVNAAAGVVLAVAVLGWRHWLPLAGTVGFGAATLGAFLLSATVGLFEITPGGQLWGPYEVIAAVAEVCCAVGGAWLLTAGRRG